MKEVRIYRDVLPEEAFLSIRRNLLELKSIKSHGTPAWHDYKRQPSNNLAEVLIRYLASTINICEGVEGAEWWIRVRPCNEFKGLHFDKDESLFEKEKLYRYPEFASIFYVDEQGGETVVLDQRKDGISHKLVPEAPTSGVLIKPKPNSFAIFPGNLYHGVLPTSQNQSDKAGNRITLLINWWRNKPLESNFDRQGSEDDVLARQKALAIAEDINFSSGHKPTEGYLQYLTQKQLNFNKAYSS